jgi:hypothetical protein
VLGFPSGNDALNGAAVIVGNMAYFCSSGSDNGKFWWFYDKKNKLGHKKTTLSTLLNK